MGSQGGSGRSAPERSGAELDRLRLRPSTMDPDGRDTLAARLASVLEGEAADAVIVAFLYGSFARGEPFRDIDIGVLLDRTAAPSYEDLDFVLRVGASLDLAAGNAVDLRVLNEAPVTLRQRAAAGKVLVCRSEEVRRRFLETTWREYLDLEPVLRRNLEDLLAP